jgi:hypothetical protein
MIIILVIQFMHGAIVMIIIFLIYDNELFCARYMTISISSRLL